MTSLCHYLTYQHNVQSYFKEHVDKYDGVIIPFSIATAFPSGTYGFIRALCSRSNDKEYALDPRTALFQKDWDRANVRDPHKRMAEVFGPPFTTKRLTKHLDPKDFKDPSVVANVTRKCLEFQKGFRTRQDDAKKLQKYKKLLGLKELKELREPQFLIPPYFEFDEPTSAWLEVSFRCAEAAVPFAGEIPIRPVIHIGSWSSIPKWTEIHRRLAASGFKGYWLYPNNFKEHEGTLSELERYRDAVQSSAAAGLEPFSLFGGYFAVLLTYYGLAGFSNG